MWRKPAVQVQVPYPLSLSPSELEENRHHFHVVQPKLEIDISLDLCARNSSSIFFTLLDFRNVMSAPAFLREQVRYIFLGRDLGRISGRILAEKASAAATIIAE